MTKLTKEAIEFAKKHLETNSDSQFFPKPFELNAIWSNWGSVSEYLLDTNIENFKPKTPIVLSIPKPNGNFRIVHRLDPLDSLIYYAIAYMVNDYAEKEHTGFIQDVSFSWKTKVDFDSGDLFTRENKFLDFLEMAKAYSENYKYVLITDISNFYCSIYIHRLQNQIATFNTTKNEINDFAKSVEKYLLNLNQKVSQGIPVGPYASHILSEVISYDIDKYIQSYNSKIKHVRYVDDIRIFSNSKKELKKILENLTCYLYKHHRLALADYKTEIISNEEFIEKYINPVYAKSKNINRIIQDLYAIDQKNIKQNEIDPIMDELISSETLSLSLARNLLKSAAKYNKRSIFTKLLNNFEFFLPAINDVVLYLNTVTNEKIADDYACEFEKIIANKNHIEFSFVNYWLVNYFIRYSAFIKKEPIKTFIEQSAEQSALFELYGRHKDINKIRENKDKISHLGSWDKRSLILAFRSLPKDERIPLLNHIIENTEDIVDVSVAKFVKSL